MPRLFGEKLRSVRRLRHLTQAAAAQQIGLATHSHISYLEAGKSEPSLEVVMRTAALFGVTTDYLLLDSIPTNPPLVTDAPLVDISLLAHHFGMRLKALRQQHDLTQVELANQLAVASQTYISLLESGRTPPSPMIVIASAELFGVSTDTFLRVPAADPASD